jgi:hypothetical protein
LERPQVNTVRKNPGQLSLGERTGAGIAINAAWHGAALVQTPENRRVIGLFNMAAVCLGRMMKLRQKIVNVHVPTPFVGRSVFLTQLTVARLRAERIIILTGIELGWRFAQHRNQIDRQAAFFQLRHDLFMSQNGFLWVLLHVVERQHASDQTKIGLRLVDARPP